MSKKWDICDVEGCNNCTETYHHRPIMQHKVPVCLHHRMHSWYKNDLSKLHVVTSKVLYVALSFYSKQFKKCCQWKPRVKSKKTLHRIIYEIMKREDEENLPMNFVDSSTHHPTDEFKPLIHTTCWPVFGYIHWHYLKPIKTVIDKKMGIFNLHVEKYYLLVACILNIRDRPIPYVLLRKIMVDFLGLKDHYLKDTIDSRLLLEGGIECGLIGTGEPMTGLTRTKSAGQHRIEKMKRKEFKRNYKIPFVL